MSLIDIDFEWWRDAKGYRLVAPEPARPAKPEMGPIYGFEVGPTLLERVGKPQRVLPNGGKRLPYQPLKRFHELYKSFASVRTPEDVLRFVEKFGLLTAHGLQPDLGDDVPFVLEHAARFRDWLDANQRRRQDLAAWIGKEGKNFGSLDAELTADASGALRVRVMPRTLLRALWIQLAYTLSGGIKIGTCLQCGDWFEAGPGARPPRRLDAKFCSDEHQRLYNSRKRSR